VSDTDGRFPDPAAGRARAGKPRPGDGSGGLAALAPFPDAHAAAGAVLDGLRQEVGFGWWAVTRVTGGTYEVLATGGAGFPLAPGEQLSWADALCRLAAEGRVPRVAPDVRAVPEFDGAPLAEHWGVGAYLSTPLTVDGASLFGTLCAFDRRPLPAGVAARLPLVDLQARLLSSVLAADLRAGASLRRAQRAESDAMQDALTGLVNRRGWHLLLDREEQRCERYGGVASVLAVDLDGLKTVNDRHGHAAGDALLRRAAAVLRDAVRSTDAVARVGGDEFAVLALETDAAGAAQERGRLQDVLDLAGVPASVGAAARLGTTGLAGAWARADAQMYETKRARQRRSRA
jgi:diguanylate cyclase (GGDEF)-like protein